VGNPALCVPTNRDGGAAGCPRLEGKPKTCRSCCREKERVMSGVELGLAPLADAWDELREVLWKLEDRISELEKQQLLNKESIKTFVRPEDLL